MFAKLKTEKLGTQSAQNSPSPHVTSARPSSLTSSVDASADERESLRGESDGEFQPKETKSNSAARDVAFLQARLKELMAKSKALKKEKEAAEANANDARRRLVEREEEILREQQKKQNEMQESFHLSLKQKEAEKQTLQKKVDEGEKLREKIMRRDVESDELKDFQNQELGKVKHMLILAENQVSKLEADSAATSSSLERESQRVEELERQLRDTEESLQLKTAQLRSLEEKSSEDTSTFTSTLKDLRSEKSAAQAENKNLAEMLNQKVAAYSVLEEKLACLEEDYARDKRAAEIYRREAEASKISSDDERSQLVEKIQGLENRLSSADLGDDEKFEALEKDRQTLERRLVESREQLTEIKTSWSSKIEALEAQISHLNLKQEKTDLQNEPYSKVDDNVDLAAKEKEVEELKAKFGAQLEDYQSRLRSADGRLAEVTSSLEEQKLKFERKLSQREAEADHLKSQLDRGKSEAESARQESTSAREEVEKLRSTVAELTEDAEASKREAEVARQEMDSTKSEMESAKKEVEKLAASLAAAESSLLEAELAAEEKVKENRVTKEEEEARWKAEREKWETERRDFEGKIASLEKKLKEEAKSLRGELERVSKANDSLLEEKNASEVKDEERRTKIEELESKIKDEKDKAVELERERERWTLEKEMMTQRERELTSKSLKKDISTSPVKKTRQEEEEEEEEMTRLRESQRRTAADLMIERKEKDALLLRNAELSQNVNSLKSQLNAANEAADAAVVATAIATSTADASASFDINASSSSSFTTQQLPSAVDPIPEVENSESSPEDLKKLISDLQSQLTERNKTVKLQQQRISDLRKTMQRELKMQSAGGASGTALAAPGINYGSSTEDLPSLCVDITSSQIPSQNHASASSSSQNPPLPPHPPALLDGADPGTAYPLGNSLPPPSLVPCSINSNGLSSSSSAAVLPEASAFPSTIPSSTSFLSSPFLSHAGSSDVDDVIFPAVSSTSGPTVVSFRYLKHVIIRFMISNEYEAQHLVKAVSTLLRFDKEEEKLVTDHLNYKVSWFGSKPSLKKLKSAKVRDVL